LYIQKGSVKLSVVTKTGKEAVVAKLKTRRLHWRRGPGRAASAHRYGYVRYTCHAARDRLKEMIHVLHAEHEFSDRFISYMVGRNIRIEDARSTGRFKTIQSVDLTILPIKNQSVPQYSIRT